MLDREISLVPRHVRRHPHLAQPRLAALPAEAHKVVRGRTDHVRHAAQQVALAVAVIIDRVFDVFGRHHLGLAEFAGPRADHFRGHQIAALDQSQGVEQMAAEHVRAPAVIGKRGERADRIVLAHAGAEIAFETPKAGDHRGGHAILLLGAVEHRLVFAHLCLPLLQPGGGHELAGEFQKAQRKDALAAVDIDDALVINQVGRRRRDGAARDALRQGLGLEAREPGLRNCRRCGSRRLQRPWKRALPLRSPRRPSVLASPCAVESSRHRSPTAIRVARKAGPQDRRLIDKSKTPLLLTGACVGTHRRISLATAIHGNIAIMRMRHQHGAH